MRQKYLYGQTNLFASTSFCSYTMIEYKTFIARKAEIKREKTISLLRILIVFPYPKIQRQHD